MNPEESCKHEHTGWDIRIGSGWTYTCKGCGATGSGKTARQAHESWMEMRSDVFFKKGQAA